MTAASPPLPCPGPTQCLDCGEEEEDQKGRKAPCLLVVILEGTVSLPSS